MERLDLTSPDLTARNIDAIYDLFPTVVTETRNDDGTVRRAIDFDLLRQELSGHVVEGPQERYGLSWPGKRKALLAANAPIRRTLRPVREESVDFDTTKNIFIEGDNLEALKLLQESYLGKVKLIYIDPPYNTGNDFIYNDDFAESAAEYLTRSGQTSESGAKLVANSESNGRFHSDWLSMMHPRLKLARNMLRNDGSIFVSISEHEVDNLRKLLEDVFGEGNFVAQIAVAKGTTTGQDAGHVGSSIDFLLVFARDWQQFTPRGLPLSEKDVSRFNRTDDRGRYSILQFRKTGNNDRRQDRPNLFYSIEAPDGSEVLPLGPGGYESCWRANMQQYVAWESGGMVVWKNDSEGRLKPYIKYYLEERTKRVSNYWDDIEGNKKATLTLKGLLGPDTFSNPKPVGLIRKILNIASDKDSIILDFFSGSATSAQAVVAANISDLGNRTHIQIQLPEPVPAGSGAAAAGYRTISEIGRDRARKFAETLPTLAVSVDAGFRVLRVDTANLVDVLRTPGQTDQVALNLLTDSVKPGRTGEDLLFQVLLDWGLELSVLIIRETVDDREVFVVDDGALIACFATSVSSAVVREIARREPLRAVFRDAGFDSDAQRINAEQVFRQVSPATDVKTI